MHEVPRGDVWRRSGRACGQVGGKLGRIGGVVRGIENESDESFGVGGERAAEDRFVDEINSKARSVAAGDVTDVVAKLIFFLIAQDGKRGDSGDELIVAKRFESRSGGRSGTERKGESETEIGIARLREMQPAVTQNEGTNPI